MLETRPPGGFGVEYVKDENGRVKRFETEPEALVAAKDYARRRLKEMRASLE